VGTRGAFGVVIGEVEKISYNQFDSYPDGCGIDNLRWLRDADLNEIRRLAESVEVVNDDRKPTTEEIAKLRPYTDLSVHEQTTDDWYCLTRDTHGDIEKMLECGYILDSSDFPLDSLFCEWAYIVDLDKNAFEAYKGFQHSPPTRGRWAGRRNENGGYAAVELVGSWPLDALPDDDEFLALDKDEEEED